jgi:hypothetical protein
MKISDVMGILLIAVGILMTVLNYVAAHSPIANVQSFEVHEIVPRGGSLAGFSQRGD